MMLLLLLLLLVGLVGAQLTFSPNCIGAPSQLWPVKAAMIDESEPNVNKPTDKDGSKLRVSGRIAGKVRQTFVWYNISNMVADVAHDIRIAVPVCECALARRCALLVRFSTHAPNDGLCARRCYVCALAARHAARVTRHAARGVERRFTQTLSRNFTARAARTATSL
jgi:hypothetical protein